MAISTTPIRGRLMTVSKPPSPWRMMAGWVAVPTLCLGAYYTAYSAYEMGQSESGIIGVIAWAFLYGISLSAVSIVGSAREAGRAKRLTKALETTPLPKILQEMDGRPGQYLAVLRGLYRQFQLCPASIDADVLMEAMETRLGERVRRVATTGQLLVCFGAIGTVVGLVGMVKGMGQAVLQAQGGSDLMLALFEPGGAMSGLSTAFMTTLVGSILGGVVLRCLASVQHRANARLVNHYWELVKTYVVPDLMHHSAATARNRSSHAAKGGDREAQTIVDR